MNLQINFYHYYRLPWAELYIYDDIHTSHANHA